MPIDIKEIKKLAEKFTPEQIEGCITEQIETGKNVCLTDEPAQKIIDELAKAEFVKNMMREGMSLADSIRELVRHMRQVQKGIAI